MKSVGRETVQITKTLEKAFTRQESQVSCGSFLGELAKVSLARGLENKPSSRDWMAGVGGAHGRASGPDYHGRRGAASA